MHPDGTLHLEYHLADHDSHMQRERCGISRSFFAGFHPDSGRMQRLI